MVVVVQDPQLIPQQAIDKMEAFPKTDPPDVGSTTMSSMLKATMVLSGKFASIKGRGDGEQKETGRSGGESPKNSLPTTMAFQQSSRLLRGLAVLKHYSLHTRTLSDSSYMLACPKVRMTPLASLRHNLLASYHSQPYHERSYILIFA